MRLYVHEFLNRVKCSDEQRIIVFSESGGFNCDCNVSEILPSVRHLIVKDFLISDGLIVLITSYEDKW